MTDAFCSSVGWLVVGRGNWSRVRVLFSCFLHGRGSICMALFSLTRAMVGRWNCNRALVFRLRAYLAVFFLCHAMPMPCLLHLLLFSPFAMAMRDTYHYEYICLDRTICWGSICSRSTSPCARGEDEPAPTDGMWIEDCVNCRLRVGKMSQR